MRKNNEGIHLIIEMSSAGQLLTPVAIYEDKEKAKWHIELAKKLMSMAAKLILITACMIVISCKEHTIVWNWEDYTHKPVRNE